MPTSSGIATFRVAQVLISVACLGCGSPALADINDYLRSEAHNAGGFGDRSKEFDGSQITPIFLDDHVAEYDPDEGKPASAGAEYSFQTHLLDFVFNQAPNNEFDEGRLSYTSNSGTLTFSPLETTGASLYFGNPMGGEGGFSWDGGGSSYHVKISVSLESISGPPLPPLGFSYDDADSTDGSIIWDETAFTLNKEAIYRLSYSFSLTPNWQEFASGSGFGFGTFELRMPDGSGIELVPVPAPSAVILATAGVCLLHWRRRRPA